MRRIAFTVTREEKERLLDAILPLLPAGVREEEQHDGTFELSSVGADLPARALLEGAAGQELIDWDAREVPADWRRRRSLFGEGHEIGGRLVVRSPWDTPPHGENVVDLVLERTGNVFGSGSHPTTRMCLELLTELDPDGGAVDLGCGIGVLALAAARLGWNPVTGIDRAPDAIDAAMANGQRNRAAVRWEVADLLEAEVPLAELMLVNAPPPVQLRLAKSLDGSSVRHVIASGVARHEIEDVVAAYAAAGLEQVQVVENGAWAAIRLERTHG